MRFLLTLCAVLMLSLLPAGSALANALPSTPPGAGTVHPAGIGIRLLDIPASTQGDPRARTYIVDRMAPGAAIERRVRVENNTPTTQTVRIYPGSAHIDGGVFIGEDAAAENELTRWTRVNQDQVEVPAGAATDVLVTIKVPADAAENEHYGAIWAEVRSPASNGVVQANRVGIRIYLSVGPGNGKPAGFSIGAITASRDQEGNPQISAEVANTGGRALDITGELRLTGGPGGLSAGPFSAKKSVTVAPGGSQPVAFSPPGGIPNGPWTASITLKSGLLEHESSAAVTFPNAGSAQPVTAAGHEGPPWLLWAAASAAVLIGVGLVAWLVLRRRTRKTAAPVKTGNKSRQFGAIDE